MHSETSHLLCQVWEHLARNKGHIEFGCCLFGVCGPLWDFRKVCSLSWNRPLVWGSYWKRFSRTSELGVAESQGGIRVGRMMWSREKQTWHLPVPTSTSVSWDSCLSLALPALTLKPVNSVPTHMCLSLFGLLPLHRSPKLVSFKWANPCSAPKEECLGLHRSSVSLGMQSPLVFLAWCDRDSSFWPWYPEFGAGLHTSSEGTSIARISLLILHCLTWVWDLLFPDLCHSRACHGFLLAIGLCSARPQVVL